jgi:hypothetical protein
MITEFKDYRELPFSQNIQDELIDRHQHNSDESVIYTEKDVLILLQMLKSEYENKETNK